nr:MAG TPA: chromosomal replication initiator protein [Caudoviricetes sp.]
MKVIDSVDINKIENIICKVFNITKEDLYSNRKYRSHTDARSSISFV